MVRENASIVDFHQTGFGEFKDEADVAFWIGILGEVHRCCILSVLISSISFNFPLTQFLTSLLWVCL